MRWRAQSDMWEQPMWERLARRALDLRHNAVMVGHCQLAVAFVGHFSRCI